MYRGGCSLSETGLLYSSVLDPVLKHLGFYICICGGYNGGVVKDAKNPYYFKLDKVLPNYAPNYSPDSRSWI